MNDSYLNTFDNLFYNVNNNSNVKNTIEQVSNVLASIITKFGELENEMCYGTSRKMISSIQLYVYSSEKLWNKLMQ